MGLESLFFWRCVFTSAGARTAFVRCFVPFTLVGSFLGDADPTEGVSRPDNLIPDCWCMRNSNTLGTRFGEDEHYIKTVVSS